MTAYLVLLYGIFMISMIVSGLGLRLGVFPGPAPLGLTVVPATFAAAVVLLALSLTVLPGDLEQRIRRRLLRSRWSERWRNVAAAGPATVAEGLRTTLALLRQHRASLLGAVGWWAFDIAVLWASFQAFGQAPPTAVIVVCYLTGLLANVLPLPGGIGGVEGGMIGAFIAFNVPSGLAIVAVLSYRAIAFWLPTIPGVIAYVGLRGTVHRWQLESATGNADPVTAPRPAHVPPPPPGPRRQP
jgi:uncharacterized membrane protein YbhN (UPF0104 family)